MSENHNYDAPPQATFKAGGIEHRWAYSTNAAIRLEAALGDDAVEQLRILQPPAEGERPQLAKRLIVLRALAWAGLQDDPELTVETLGAMLRPDDMVDLSLSLLHCMSEGLRRNPMTAETATADSAAGPPPAPSA